MENASNKFNKSSLKATISFIFGLTFWIPILNLIFGIGAIYFGIRALINIRKEPSKYSGKWLALIGLILGALVWITYFVGIGTCLSGNKGICSSIGLGFLT
ncbi:MAG: DUF4190 domain-containing protein [Nanoarchaeota archaeon]